MGSQRQVSVLVNHWLKTLQTSIAGQYCSGLQRPWTLPVPHLAAIRLFLSDAHKQPQWKKGLHCVHCTWTSVARVGFWTLGPVQSLSQSGAELKDDSLWESIPHLCWKPGCFLIKGMAQPKKYEYSVIIYSVSCHSFHTCMTLFPL